MELNHQRTLQAVALLLLLIVVTQVAYTALYLASQDIPRQWLWGLEGLLFILLATFAGSALAQAKQYTLGHSAILACAILNVVQVAVGLTQFGPFHEASQQVEGLAPATASVVALSFFIYNAAKALIGFAAVLFGLGKYQGGAKVLGGLTVLIGVAAFVTNTVVMMFGRMEMVPSGATGVVATLLLAVCLFGLSKEST